MSFEVELVDPCALDVSCALSVPGEADAPLPELPELLFVVLGISL